MKKFYLLLTLLLVAFVSRATVVTWTYPDNYPGDAKAETTNGATIKFTKGGTATNANFSDHIRLYGGGTFQISISSGTFNSIKIYYNKNKGSNTISASPGTIDNDAIGTSSTTFNEAIWTPTGKEKSVTFTVGDKSGHAKINSIVVDYGDGVVTKCYTPSFSEAGGTFYGDAGKTLDVTLSCETPNSTIKYTVKGGEENGGEEKTYNGTNIPELVFPGTYEVTAWATKDGLDNSATATATYELVDVSSLTKFTKVTDAKVLKAGDKVIIVNEKAAQAMSTNQKSDNRGTTTYIPSGEAILETGDIQVVTLEDAVTEKGVKGFAFNTGKGYLYSASSEKNYLRTREANDDDNGIWTISIDGSGNATIKSQGANTRNTIKYNNSNSTNTIFSSYSSGQQPVQLYYSPAPAATACADPTFSVSEGTFYGKAGETKEVSLSCTTDGATIMYSTDGENYNAYKAPISITCPSETTISAYAKMENGSLGNSETVSKTYNYVVYPSVASIADFKTKGAAGADKTKPYMFTCPLTVTYQNDKRLYLRDAAGDAILVFGAIDKTYEAGNQLPANSVVGTYKVYNQMVEIIPVEGVTWPTTETIVDAAPIEMTIDQLNAVSAEQWSTIASKLVVIKGAKVSADGSTITVGDAKLANVYAKRFNPTLENASAVYDVVGIIETHWNKTDQVVDGIQFCQTAYLDNYSPAKLYMMGKIQNHNQVWNPTQGLVMEKEAAGIYSADVNLSFDDYFAITTDLSIYEDWDYVNGRRYAYNGGLAKMATDYEMTKDSGATTHVFWTGNFKVTVNFPANTISFVPAAVDAQGEPDYATVFPEKLRIVGEIADGEWAGKSVVENHLATRGEDGYTYTFNELQFVKNGNFRFTTAWDATIWDGNDSDNKDNTNYTVNDRALKAATDAEPRINFNTVANILPFTSNDLVADVQKYSPDKDLVYANLQLIVNLKDMTVKGMMYSGVSQIKVGGATVTATNGTIRVDGGNTTSIYNIAGQAIALGSKAKEFSVASGMYIVNVDGKATKVVVR